MADYNSTVLTLVRTTTPDPYMTTAHGQFYLTFTAGDHIEIWSASSLVHFRDNHRSTTIWKPPPGTEHSDGLWAPELHCLQGRWWVFYAAAHPRFGNKSHRMWVLAGPPASQDPTLGRWDFAGPIVGLAPDQWAIDGTVFEMRGQLYFVYSGWPLGVHNNDLMQHLFIVSLDTPTRASSKPIEISRPDHQWEFSHDGNGAHGINEGPQFLASPNGAWAGIVYSCAGSWTKDYKMAVLNYRGGNPLNPGSWIKDTKPLLQSAPGRRGPWGPGHGSFVHLGNETIAVYHATDNPTDGWANRKARVQRIAWTMHGPSMGTHCGPLTTDINGEALSLSHQVLQLAHPSQSSQRAFHELKLIIRVAGMVSRRWLALQSMSYGTSDMYTYLCRAFTSSRAASCI